MTARPLPRARFSEPGVTAAARCSRSAVGAFLVALEELDRAGGHHCGDRMLVDKLRMTVPTQQDGEIVEPRDDTLQLDAVDQEDGDRRLVLADVVEEDVLDILRFFSCHFCCPFPLLE